MPHLVDWLIPQRVFYSHPEGIVTLDFAMQVNSHHERFLSQGDAPVHMLINIKDVTTSLNVVQVRNTQRYLKHPNLGWVVICGANSFLSLALTIVTNLAHVQFKMVNSCEDGVSFLKTIDTSLDWSKAQENVFTMKSDQSQRV